MTEENLEELIRKYADGTASDDEVQQLLHWYRSASVGNVPWPAGGPAEKQDTYRRMLRRLHRKVPAKPVRVFRLSRVQVAVLLLVIAGAAYLVLTLDPFTEPYIAVSNPSGKIQRVRLPDSSSVWLNASSSIRYAKAFGKNRQLELKGEAYFEVTHDAGHPFSVVAGDVRTTVLGTSFNIKAYEREDRTTISVISGKVRVNSDRKSLAVLTPSLQLLYDRHGKTATTAALDTGSVLAWKKGRLQFAGQTMAEIAGALERWYGVRIELANPAMRTCRYYMGFDNTLPLEKLLSVMSGITEMQYAFSTDRNKIILSGGECR